MVLVWYCIAILEPWYCIGIVLLENSYYCSCIAAMAGYSIDDFKTANARFPFNHGDPVLVVCDARNQYCSQKLMKIESKVIKSL